MKLDATVKIKTSLKYYVEREITGKEFSKEVKECVETYESLDKSQVRTFNYYIDFFDKEGKDLYLKTNVYLKGEVEELKEFLNSFE